MKEIILKAKAGDKQALDELYRDTSEELSYYCRRLCGNKHDADDLVQETYLTAFQKLEQYRQDKSFKAWLHTIALHKFYNRIRAEKPQLFTEGIDDIYEDELKGPESYAENRELQDLLMHLIEEKLNEPQRMVVMMFYYDGMSVGDIAVVLDCPEGTVKTRLYHSRRILKQELIKRGFSTAGGLVLVSSALKIQTSGALTASAVSAASGEAVKETAKHIGRFTAKKIIASAAAVTVAGGAAIAVYRNSVAEKPDERSDTDKIIVTMSEHPEVGTAVPAPKTEPPTEPQTEPSAEKPAGISVPGGEPVSFTLTAEFYSISIPENYEPVFERTLEPDASELSKQNYEKYIRQLREDHILVYHVGENNSLFFMPDEFSGDSVMLTGIAYDDSFDISAYLEEKYGAVQIVSEKDIQIDSDDTGRRWDFTGGNDGDKFSGTAIAFEHIHDGLIVFIDHSGIRCQEYEDIISSLNLF